MKNKFCLVLALLPLMASCNSATSTSSATSSAQAESSVSSVEQTSSVSSESVVSSSEESAESSLSSSAEPSLTFEHRAIPVYLGSGEAAVSYDTYFINGRKNIPYISLEDFFGKTFPEFDMSTENGVFAVSYSGSEATMSVNTNTNIITFSDWYALFNTRDSVSYVNSEVDLNYFQEEAVSYEPADGYTMESSVDLASYGMQTYDLNGTVVMPSAVAFSLFLFQTPICYNGYAYFGTNGIYSSAGNLTEHGAFMKAVPSDFVYDEALRDYAYQELCLSLDFYYGMKDLRGYGNFDTLLTQEGIKAKIYEGEPDSAKFDAAMNDIFNVLLTDYGHTYINVDGTSIFRQKEFEKGTEITFADKMIENSDICTQIQQEKERLEINQALLQDEDSKTLILNFDSFSWFQTDDQGEVVIGGNTSSDIVYQANDYIQKNSDAYDNVIINLTCNGGGDDLAELYLSSWIHGTAYQYAFAPINHYAKSVSKYVADVNLDGVYDEKDNISDKKVYLLTSNFSYSNGNVFPGEMKGSENVTLIGQKTGGGSCNVLPFVTAIGNRYSMSSLTRAATHNWESIETGVDPDIVLDDPLDTCDYPTIIQNYILGVNEEE